MLAMVRTLALALALVGCASSQGVESDAGDGPRRGGAEVPGQPDGAVAPEALPADGAAVDARPIDPLALASCADVNAPPQGLGFCGAAYLREPDRRPVCHGRAIGPYLCSLCTWFCDGAVTRPLVALPCRVANTWSATPATCSPELIVCVQRCEDCPAVQPPAIWCAAP